MSRGGRREPEREFGPGVEFIYYEGWLSKVLAHFSKPKEGSKLSWK